MYSVRKVTDGLYWVGTNDHRIALFENCFPVPRGVSYNAYVLLDEKTVLFDTVDWSGCRQFLENLEYVLDGRPLDYIVVNHLEPDHAASLEVVLGKYPDTKIISNEKAFMIMHQFGFSVNASRSPRETPSVSAPIRSPLCSRPWSTGRKPWSPST